MRNINYLKDTPFLEKLVKEKNKVVYSKVVILDKEELPLESIEGKITTGSINIQGNAAVRRTGSLTFTAEEKNNNLTNINNILSINKKIKIYIGIENNINIRYDKIIWFPLGIFVITQPNISHSLSGVIISLNFKDKMCLLNGECGGTLPTSVTFHEYDQVIGYLKVDKLPADANDYTIYGIIENNNLNYYSWDDNTGWQKSDYNLVGTVISRPQTIFNIIWTLVLNYGNENPSKIFINDVPLEIKSSVRYIGSEILYHNPTTGVYTLNQNDLLGLSEEDMKKVKEYYYNEDVGYIYTPFTYPGELISGIGENVCSVLDKIKNALGNYEYFYDIEGNFIFQEIKNYLNNSFNYFDAIKDPSLKENNYFDYSDIPKNSYILDNNNYQVGFNNTLKTVYVFEEGSSLISSFANTPNYLNIKNNFHIWGKNKDGFPIHYHVAIKSKPIVMNNYYVIFLKDEKGNYTGGLRLPSEQDFLAPDAVNVETLNLEEDEALIRELEKEYQIVLKKPYMHEEGVLYLTKGLISRYKPTDWRAELYLQGLQKRKNGQRPDIFEQELLDKFDNIYNFKEQSYRTDIVERPNSLKYYIDFLEPTEQLHDCSIDSLGLKTYSYQQDKVNKIYNKDIPNYILINVNYTAFSRAKIIQRCEEEGQPYANITQNVYSNLAIGTSGYSAHETARELLYQYTGYNEAISITSVPIYYLDVNNRISVYDKASDIYGDYIINSISLPLDGKSTMSISATRALERL